MKILLSLMLGISLYGGSVKGGMSDNQVVAVQKMIKLYGYKCDWVNFAMVSPWSGMIDVSCNDSRYSYDLKDVGGRIVVTVD